MSTPLFDPPPRRRGRGWWRRFWSFVLLVAFGSVLVGLSLALAVVEPNENPLLTYGLIGYGVLVVGFVLVPSFRISREMRLLRNGIELVTQGTGFEVRVTHGDRSVVLRPPSASHRLIPVEGSTGLGGYVVLASANLRRSFFPSVSDLPIHRLLGEERVVRRLPVPVRATNSRWNEWLRRKYGSLRGACVILTLSVAIGTGFALGLGSGPVLWGVDAILIAVDSVLVLLWLRRYWRDRILWREGEEFHAILLETKEQGSSCHYSYAYHFGGYDFRRAEHLPSDVPAWRVESPPGASAVTERVILLVDPNRPERCALIPAEMAGAAD